MSLASQVEAAWRSLGVPSSIWAPIEDVESGGNPLAVGDSGTSFGLLQLHVDGGQGTGYAPDQLLNPLTNIAIGGPPIATAYKAGRKLGLSGLSLLDFTAAHSGHPGGGTLPASYARRLAAAYNAPEHSLGAVNTATDTTASGDMYGTEALFGGFQYSGGENVGGQNVVANPSPFASVGGTPPPAGGNVFGNAWDLGTQGAKAGSNGIAAQLGIIGKDFGDVAKFFGEVGTWGGDFVDWLKSGNALYLLIGLVLGTIAVVVLLHD